GTVLLRCRGPRTPRENSERAAGEDSRPFSSPPLSVRCNCRFHCDPNCAAFNRQIIPHAVMLFVARTVHATTRCIYGKPSRKQSRRSREASRWCHRPCCPCAEQPPTAKHRARKDVGPRAKRSAGVWAVEQASDRG